MRSIDLPGIIQLVHVPFPRSHIFSCSHNPPIGEIPANATLPSIQLADMWRDRVSRNANGEVIQKEGQAARMWGEEENPNYAHIVCISRK